MNLNDKKTLSAENLNKCIAISPGHSLGGQPIDSLVRKCICDFLTKMISDEVNDRPNAHQVMSFFEAAALVANLSEQCPKEKGTQYSLWLADHQHDIQILLLKIKIFSLGLFNIKLTVNRLEGEKQTHGLVSDYDFTRMKSEDNRKFSTISKQISLLFTNEVADKNEGSRAFWTITDKISRLFTNNVPDEKIDQLMRENLELVSKRKQIAVKLVEKIQSEKQSKQNTTETSDIVNEAIGEALLSEESTFSDNLSRFLIRFNDQQIIPLEKLIERLPTRTVLALIEQDQQTDLNYKDKLQLWKEYRLIKSMNESNPTRQEKKESKTQDHPTQWIDKMFNQNFRDHIENDQTFQELIYFLQNDKNTKVLPNLVFGLSLIKYRKELVEQYKLVTEQEIEKLLNDSNKIIQSHLEKMKKILLNDNPSAFNYTSTDMKKRKNFLFNRVSAFLLLQHDKSKNQEQQKLSTEERKDIKIIFPELHKLVSLNCSPAVEDDLNEKKYCSVM
jgi:hypothetical protein